MIQTGGTVIGYRRGYRYKGTAEVLPRGSGMPQRVRVYDSTTGDTLAVLHADEVTKVSRRR